MTDWLLAVSCFIFLSLGYLWLIHHPLSRVCKVLTPTHPRRSLERSSRVWLCRCTSPHALGWRSRAWSGRSASPVWRPGRSAWHWGAPRRPSSAGWWCQGGGNHSHGRWGCFLCQTLLGCDCTPGPWVGLKATQRRTLCQTIIVEQADAWNKIIFQKCMYL